MYDTYIYIYFQYIHPHAFCHPAMAYKHRVGVSAILSLHSSMELHGGAMEVLPSTFQVVWIIDPPKGIVKYTWNPDVSSCEWMFGFIFPKILAWSNRNKNLFM